MGRLRKRPFQIVNGGNNEQPFPNLWNTKVGCLKNTVRHMVAQFIQLPLDDSDYRFTTMCPCLFHIRNILHDDVIRLQHARHTKKLQE